MYDTRDFLDAPLEHAESRGIGEHDAGRLRTDSGAQGLEIDVAVPVDGYLLHDTPAHRCGGRVGAVCRLGHDDLVAGQIAACAVVRTDHGHSGKFAVRARHRAERHALHARHFLQHLLQLEQAGENPLAV